MPDFPRGFLDLPGPVNLLVLILATWRAAVMVMRDDGPFGGFRALREFGGVTHDVDGDVVSWPQGSPLVCMACMSMWVAVPIILLWLAVPWAAYLLAVSAGAMLVERAVSRG